VPVIDFHTHIFPPEIIAQRKVYLQRDSWFRQLYADPKARMASADDLIASMGRCGVDASATFGFAWADQGLCRTVNDYVLESVSCWPERLFGFADYPLIGQEHFLRRVRGSGLSADALESVLGGYATRLLRGG